MILDMGRRECLLFMISHSEALLSLLDTRWCFLIYISDTPSLTYPDKSHLVCFSYAFHAGCVLTSAFISQGLLRGSFIVAGLASRDN